MISENGEVAATEAGSGRGQPWKARTHCGRGHEFTPENTAYRTDGYGGARRCLECKRARYREYYARRGSALRKAQRAAMKAAGQ
jgi:hypothetical protein